MELMEAMAYVDGFSHSGEPVRDLSRIRMLMDRLGNPQERLKFVHIAGTNGKGSAAEYLTNVFRRAGYRTGTLISPFIRRYNDRIRLDGEEIGMRDLCGLCQILETAAQPGEGFSQFEITFAIAMLWFVRQKTDIVVLETGMGGLVDCTNIISPPEACVLMSISLDHQAILGQTLPEITAQKAGIIKSGTLVIVSPKNEPETIEAFRQKCREVGADFRLTAGEGFELLDSTLTGTKFRYRGQAFETRMGGRHQAANAVTAIETALALRERGWVLPDAAIACGIAETSVPGRMQLLSRDPLVLMDGGHNADGIEALKNTLLSAKTMPLTGIIGMTHADAVDYAARVLPEVFDMMLCVDGFAPNAVPAAVLDAAFDRTMGGAHSHSTQLSEALKIAKAWAYQNGGGIVICGSLYLISWFLQEEG